MNILLCGLLWSGSGAVLDLLKEYSGNVVLPNEFDEFRRPGMIADHLDGRISDYYPSLINEYVQNRRAQLAQLGSGALPFNIKLIEFKRLTLLENLKKNITDKEQDEQIELVKQWVNDYKHLYANDGRLVIDQPILIGQHKKIWPKVFDPFKLIIVYRDPLDQMAEIMRQGHLFYHMRSPTADIYGGDRSGAVEFQIDTLKSRYKHVQSIVEQHGEDKVLLLKFENVVRNYDAIKSQIEAFLGLDPSSHSSPKKHFEPMKSINNIGIYNKYLTEEEILKLEDFKQWASKMELFET